MTVMIVTVEHPDGAVYVIYTDPGVSPCTTPDVRPIEAMVGSLLLHVPPVTASVSVSVVPGHKVSAPTIDGGSGLTVTEVVTKHPLDAV